MKSLLPGIWEWSWFSEEKQLDFNGHLLAVGEHRIVVDPPPVPPADLALLKQGNRIDYILLTNRDHQREADWLSRELGCQVMAPELDAPHMSVRIDRTFKDGELLPGGIWVIQLTGQKSPGESALFLQKGKGILIVGDALIGDPPGALRLLPDDKYENVQVAREGLQRLRKLSFDSLLVGDGTSLITNAKAVVEGCLEK